MLTQNSELRPLGIWNWTLPAWVVTDTQGRTWNVCPNAKGCIRVCYARNGAYNFSNVKAAHVRNLEHVAYRLDDWTGAMIEELGKKKYRAKGRPILPDLPRDHLSPTVATLLDVGGACVRIHDSGDFFTKEYLSAWLQVARSRPGVLFYTYTKQVSWVKNLDPGTIPANFLFCFSFGGREDSLIDRDADRHADVFPTEEAIIAGGYYSQTSHDLLCVIAPSRKIGIRSNNIPHFQKRLAGRRFSELSRSPEGDSG